jgi:glycosyltransferase involved in cell wall biosynthesis
VKVAFVYPNSWEHAYPHLRDEIDAAVWCVSDSIPMRFARAVQPFGVEPTVYYLSQSARTPATFTHKAGFKMRRIPVRFGAGHWDRECSWRIVRETIGGGFDMLHFNSIYRNYRYPDMYDFFALACRVAGVPFVADFHGGTFPGIFARTRLKRMLNAPRRWLKAFALRQADRLLIINGEEIGRLTDPRHPRYYGVHVSKRRVIPLPVIVDQSVFRPMDRAEACAAAGLDPSRRHILYVGFLREPKGVQDLLAVMPRLAAEEPRLHLLIVGSGEYESALRDRAKQLHVEEVVTFVGPVTSERLPPFYNSAAVHVLPSYQEGLSQVLLEALACNVPSVGTTVGGTPELLGDGVGLLVPPADQEKLAQAIRQVLAGRFSMNPDARSRILKRQSVEHAGQVLRDTYADVLQERRQCCRAKRQDRKRQPAGGAIERQL